MNKLRSLTPDNWGVIEELGNYGVLNIDDVKVILLQIANKRILIAEEYLELAKHLLDNNLQYRSVISRAYYAMYHAARAAVYIQMRLDVSKHRQLIKKFRKVLIRIYGDDLLSECMNDWRNERNKCDYNPFFEPNEELCRQAIADGSRILDACKNLIR